MWEVQDMNSCELVFDQDALRTVNALKMALKRREEVRQMIDQASHESTAITHLAMMVDAEGSDGNSIFHLQVISWFGTCRERLAEKVDGLRLILESDATQP